MALALKSMNHWVMYSTFKLEVLLTKCDCVNINVVSDAFSHPDKTKSGV